MYSQNNEEEIILNFFKEKKGIFLDLGAYDGIGLSNTRALAEKGWKGVCVEQTAYKEAYKKQRTCLFLNENATKIDYKTILESQGIPKRLDYLSIDIDEGSAEALKAIPFDYTYLYGHVFK